MSVAARRKIDVAVYDRSIRTFIPGYRRLIEATARTCAVALHGTKRPTIVDVGIGTGALAARCLAEMPSATIVGIDPDADMLRVAMRRFARRPAPVTLVHGDLATTPLPPADAIVAALALRHAPTAPAKRAFYRRCFKALRPGGIVASGDCHPSAVAAVAASQMAGWIDHMRQHHTPAEVRRYVEARADEDTYMTLEEELGILQHAGFAVDVTWRHRGFAVVVGVKP